MVKRCCYGICNTDSRYPERLEDGVTFIPFPKPTTKLEKCQRWIRLCGRAHDQLNVTILQQHSKAKHFYVCSKHFIEGHPTLSNPDPVPAIVHDKITPVRPPPKPRALSEPPKKRVRVALDESFRLSDNGAENIPVQSAAILDKNIGDQKENYPQAGIKLLVQLAEGDLPVLDFLNDFTQEVLDSGYQGNTEFYLRTHQFVSQLERFYRQKNSQCPYYLISFFRHMITLISETLFLSATSDVCKTAIDSVVVTSPVIRIKMRDLMNTIENMQHRTIQLEIEIIKHIKDNNKFQIDQIDSKAVMTQADQLWRLVRRCEAPLKKITNAVEQKASADQTFFQRASLGIGAVCAGRFLWSLYKGDNPEQLINARLWSIGTGLSGAVLQIPRARAQRIMDEIARRKGKKQDLQDLVKHWLIESDGLCARLVLYSSFNGSKLM